MPKKIVIEDPIMRRAYTQTQRLRRRTTVGAVEALMQERTFWSRRLTIASNKLADVQRRLDAVTTQLADDRFASDLQNLNP